MLTSDNLKITPSRYHHHEGRRPVVIQAFCWITPHLSMLAKTVAREGIKLSLALIVLCTSCWSNREQDMQHIASCALKSWAGNVEGDECSIHYTTMHGPKAAGAEIWQLNEQALVVSFAPPEADNPLMLFDPDHPHKGNVWHAPWNCGFQVSELISDALITKYTRWFFTGCDAAGSSAAIAALYFKTKHPSLNVEVISFGGHSPGNAAFAKHFNSIITPDRATSFVCDCCADMCVDCFESQGCVGKPTRIPESLKPILSTGVATGSEDLDQSSDVGPHGNAPQYPLVARSSARTCHGANPQVKT